MKASAKAIIEQVAKTLPQYRNDPVGFARRILGVEPHEGQQRWLVNSTNTENALCCGNRWGKSEAAAMKLLWKCAYRIGWNQQTTALMRQKHERYHAINISITADQSRLVWQKARGMLESPKASWLVDGDVISSPFPKINFVTGSVLEARSTARDAEHLLGNSFDGINYDEVAFEKHFIRIRDNVLRMRVVDRKGTIDYTSTGNGRNEWGCYFLDGLSGRDPNLYSQTGSSFENPYIDHERLRLNVARMSPKQRAQNIDGAIIDAAGEYFPIEDLEAAHDETLDAMLKQTFDEEEQTNWAELFPGGKRWRDVYPSHKYLSSWDLAEKKDWAVGCTWDVSTKPFTLVEFERFHRKGWSHVYDRMRARDRKYGAGTTTFDSTGVGDVVANELKDIRAKGVNFSGGRKDEMLVNVQAMLSKSEIRWPDIRVLRTEMAFYERDDDNLIKDCVMSIAVGMHFANKRPATVGGFSYGTVRNSAELPTRQRGTGAVQSFGNMKRMLIEHAKNHVDPSARDRIE